MSADTEQRPFYNAVVNCLFYQLQIYAVMLIEAKLLRTRPRTRTKPRGRGRGRGQLVEAEAEAEDKISASRTVWPRGLNITGYMFCGTRYLSHCHTIPLRFTLVNYDFLQPMLVSNSNISLKISTFGSRDIASHVAIYQQFTDRLSIIAIPLSCTVTEI